MPCTHVRGRPGRPLALAASVTGLVGLILAGAVGADICGCADSPSLGDFDSADPSTWPPDTQVSSGRIRLALPPDGVLVFDRFSVGLGPGGWSATVQFEHNAANTPVTLLIKGDLDIDWYGSIEVNGERGGSGSTGLSGLGGLGGPGGFRGGDGAYQLVNLGSDGGAGLGPGGGPGATLAATALPGQFVGTPELLPLLGGAGGGGGHSASDASGCSGGGGGGGGGALLIAANGAVRIVGSISADGGVGGSAGNSTCASAGARGSGGALRILAERIEGDGWLYARGPAAASHGRIRLEAYENSMGASRITPPASRVQAPGPLVNPIQPTLAITAVNGEMLSRQSGEPIATLPQGVFGLVDLVLPAPGFVDIDLATSGVPANTLIAVSLKASPNGQSEIGWVNIDPTDCDLNGDCTALLTFPEVQAGRYVLEAEATFETP